MSALAPAPGRHAVAYGRSGAGYTVSAPPPSSLTPRCGGLRRSSLTPRCGGLRPSSLTPRCGVWAERRGVHSECGGAVRRSLDRRTPTNRHLLRAAAGSQRGTAHPRHDGRIRGHVGFGRAADRGPRASWTGRLRLGVHRLPRSQRRRHGHLVGDQRPARPTRADEPRPDALRLRPAGLRTGPDHVAAGARPGRTGPRRRTDHHRAVRGDRRVVPGGAAAALLRRNLVGLGAAVACWARRSRARSPST